MCTEKTMFANQEKANKSLREMYNIPSRLLLALQAKIPQLNECIFDNKNKETLFFIKKNNNNRWQFDFGKLRKVRFMSRHSYVKKVEAKRQNFNYKCELRSLCFMHSCTTKPIPLLYLFLITNQCSCPLHQMSSNMTTKVENQDSRGNCD